MVGIFDPGSFLAAREDLLHLIDLGLLRAHDPLSERQDLGVDHDRESYVHPLTGFVLLRVHDLPPAPRWVTSWTW